jgi:hypothetical protein
VSFVVWGLAEEGDQPFLEETSGLTEEAAYGRPETWG